MTINKNLIFLTFQIIESIDSDYQYVSLITHSTRIILAQLIVDQSRSQTFTDINRIRTTLKTSDELFRT